MCAIKLLFIVLVVSLFVVLCCGRKLHSRPTVISKHYKNGIQQNKFVQNVLRKVKMNFCSDLEGLSLQLTQPNSDALSLTDIDQITNIINTEYDDSQFVIGLMVKLSRKFAESNVHTKLKSLLSLHRLMESTQEQAQTALSSTVLLLQKEIDDKLQSPYFSMQSLDLASSQAENMVEIKTFKLVKVYATYLFNFLALKATSGDKKSPRVSVSRKNNTGSSPSSKADVLVSLVQQGETVGVACRRLRGPLYKQLLDSLKMDKVWAIRQLKKLQETGQVTDDQMNAERITLLLKELDSEMADGKAQRPASAGRSGTRRRKVAPLKQQTQSDLPTISSR